MSFTMNSIKSKYKNIDLPGERASRDTLLTDFISGPIATSSFLSNLARVPAKYYLEIRNGDEIVAVMSFPYDPSDVVYERQNPIRTNYTIGGVIREFNTIRKHNVLLSGRSGIAYRTAYTRRGGIIYTEGEAVFQEFDEFLKRYVEICAKEFGLPNAIMASDLVANDLKYKQGTNAGESIYMILRCIDEDLHLKVEPVNFRWDKSSQGQRFDYRWTCQFLAYDYAETNKNFFAKALDFVDNYVASAGGVVGTLNNIVNNVSNDYVGRLRKSIGKIANTTQVLSETSSAVGGLTSNIFGVASDFNYLVERLGYVADDFSELSNQILQQTGLENVSVIDNVALSQGLAALSIVSQDDNVNIDEYANIQNNLTLLKNISANLRGNIPRDYYNRRIFNIENNLETIPTGTFLGDERNFSLLSSGNIENNRNDDIANRNYFTHYLQKNEDLISLANKYLGSPEQYPVLMKINNWRSARTDQFGELAKIGTKILIPNPGNATTNPFGNKNDFIGYDLLINDDGDLQFNNKGDFQLISGNENMQQAIKNQLLTTSGEVIGHKVGLPQVPNLSDLAYAAAIVKETLSRDPRILSVNNINLSFADDTLFCDCKIQLKNDSSIDVKTIL